MKVRFSIPLRQNPAKQGGIALVVALLLLVIATLTGMSGIRNATLQESLAGNLYDRALAMQAAEAALVAASAALSANTVKKIEDCMTGGTPCRVVPANTFSGTDSNWQDALEFTVNTGLMPDDTNPQFYIQWVGVETVPLTGQAANCLQYGSESACPEARFNLYRITGRSGDPTVDNGRAIVALSRIARVPT